MKKFFSMTLLAVLFFTTFISAQVTEPVKEVAKEAIPVVKEALPANSNPTVDAIRSKYQMAEMPAALTIEKIYPVIGDYTSAENTEIPSLKVTINPDKKSEIWIDGLPQGRVTAFLQKSPAVYKIPAQKTEAGTDVKEGTLIYDNEANKLNICLGKDFNLMDPAAVFMTATADEAVPAKGKTAKKTNKAVKPWIYTATKVSVATETVATESKL